MPDSPQSFYPASKMVPDAAPAKPVPAPAPASTPPAPATGPARLYENSGMVADVHDLNSSGRPIAPPKPEAKPSRSRNKRQPSRRRNRRISRPRLRLCVPSW